MADETLTFMDYSELYGQGGGGSGGGSGKAASSSSSSTSGNDFGSGQLVNDNGGLTPLAGLILAGLTMFAFLGLIIVSKK